MSYTNYKVIMSATRVPGNGLEVAKIFATSYENAIKKAVKTVLKAMAGEAAKYLDINVQSTDYWTVISGIPKDIVPKEYRNAIGHDGSVRLQVIENFRKGKTVIHNYAVCENREFHNYAHYCDVHIPNSWVLMDSKNIPHGSLVQVQDGAYHYNCDKQDIYWLGGNSYAKITYEDNSVQGCPYTQEKAEIEYFSL